MNCKETGLQLTRLFEAACNHGSVLLLQLLMAMTPDLRSKVKCLDKTELYFLRLNHIGRSKLIYNTQLSEPQVPYGHHRRGTPDDEV